MKTNRALPRIVACAVLMVLWTAARGRGDDAATHPTDSNPPHRPGPAMVIQRLREATSQLDLSDDEKAKVDAIFAQASQDADDLSQQLADDAQGQRYEQLIAFGKSLRQKLTDVLSDDQVKALDEKLRERGRPAGGAGLGGGMLGLLQQATSKLDLSADQEQQVEELFDKIRGQIQDVRNGDAGGQARRARLQQIREDARAGLQKILTPDQTQTLEQMIQQYRQNQGASGGVPKANTSESAPKVAAGARAPSGDGKGQPADLQGTGPALGSPAPDVRLWELNGHTLEPSAYKGRVVVLEFGSLSSPTFRDHVKQMEALKSSEGPKAFIVVVYTREAFPAGGRNVQRNQDDGISVTDAGTLEGRKAEAESAQARLGITLPMAVDSMDNAATNAYGAFPNGAVVIGEDGRVAAWEEWTNPDSLRRAIDEAFAK